MNGELSDVQAGFRKGRGTRDQIANICWIIEKAREFQKEKKKTSISASLTMLNPLCGSQQTGKFLTCLLRNLYADQEVTHRTGHGTAD